MKNKIKSRTEIIEEEDLTSIDREALEEFLDYYATNGVEILRGNPMYVNGLMKLMPDKNSNMALGSLKELLI